MHFLVSFRAKQGTKTMNNKALNINTFVMLLVSLMFAYVAANMLVSVGATTAYSWGFIIGRAVMGVLLPLAIVYFPLALIRRGKPKFTKGTYITWWVLFVLLSIMALLGSAVPPSAN